MRETITKRSDRKETFMKKLLACMLTGVLALSLGACGSREEKAADTEAVIEANEALEAENEAEAEAESEAEAAEEAEEAAEEAEEAETPTIEGGDEVSTDKINISVEEAEEETAQVEAQEAVDAPDVSQAVEGSETSEENPAAFGTWVKTALYATQDSTYHTVYVRVAKVTTQSADAEYVASALEASNAYSEEFEQISTEDLDVPSDGELVVMDYEVYVPADFPAPNYGMTEPRLYISMQNIGGGGFPSLDGENVYLGMGTAENLAVREAGEVYMPGNTYGERCIYAMVQGYTDYLATYSSYPEGTTSDGTNADIMYTVYQRVQ